MKLQVFFILMQIVEILCCKNITHHRRHPHHNHGIKSRIFNGREVDLWQVGYYLAQLIDYNYMLCTSSIISSRHLLTAAHCLYGKDYSRIHVVVGRSAAYQFSYFEEKNFLRDAIIHPTYKSARSVGDIAVARVRNEMYGRYVDPIPLCSDFVEPGSMVQVSGWGRNEYSARSNLRTMWVPAVSKSECNWKTRRVLPANVLCAFGYNGKTVCFGDSGGPLVYNGEVCGVTSATFGCGGRHIPDLYMSVYFYRYFITSSMDKLRDDKQKDEEKKKDEDKDKGSIFDIIDWWWWRKRKTEKK